MSATNNSTRDVDIVEVSPRDGFQSIAEPLPTDTKIGIIEGLIAAGCPRIEVGSFVSPKAVPQMADMGRIAEHFRGTTGARFSVLVPNVRGLELALASGFNEIVYVFSASESHNQRNVRRSVGDSVADLARLVEILEAHGEHQLRLDLGTAFDCPFDGRVDLQTTRAAVRRIWEVTPRVEIALCDTTGRANPVQVRDYFSALMAECPHPETTWAFHGHDTFGMGVANALFAYEAGVRVFDASAAGLGGCPFAPGATGNTATEDMAFAFEEAGIRTGIDFEALLATADRIAALPGASVASHLRNVPRQRVTESRVA